MSSWFCGYQGWQAHSALARVCGDTRFIACWSPTGEQCHVWALWGRYSSEVSRFVYWDFIGLLKGYELKLHIDDSVKPVAQPVHSILFGLGEKVEKNWTSCYKQMFWRSGGRSDLLDFFLSGCAKEWWWRQGYTSCVDILRANEAIIRERHPIPTVEELCTL